MDEARKNKKRGPGRPPRPMPPRIDASPEAVARMLVTTPPKKEEDWRYLKTKPALPAE